MEITDLQNMEVILTLDMEVRYTTAHTMVEESCGQAAIERGPLVYCCEGVDTKAPALDDLYLDWTRSISLRRLKSKDGGLWPFAARCIA